MKKIKYIQNIDDIIFSTDNELLVTINKEFFVIYKNHKKIVYIKNIDLEEVYNKIKDADVDNIDIIEFLIYFNKINKSQNEERLKIKEQERLKIKEQEIKKLWEWIDAKDYWLKTKDEKINELNNRKIIRIISKMKRWWNNVKIQKKQ